MSPLLKFTVHLLIKKMSETHPLNPRSPYAAAKCGADRLVFSYGTSLIYLL